MRRAVLICVMLAVLSPRDAIASKMLPDAPWHREDYADEVIE
jgi:hypothetical protein